jgi:3-oxoacyl-[acyl-carrier protein] reductase
MAQIDDVGSPGARSPSEWWALVAGATGCVGRAVAHGIAATGRNVVVHSGRRPAVVLDMAQELSQRYGIRAVAVDADITDDGQLSRLSGALDRAGIGSIAALVNCATAFSGDLRPANRIEHGEFRHLLDVDVIGPYLLVRELLPLLVAAGTSRIVLLTTRVAPHCGAAAVHLSAAKAGVHGLVSALGEELDEYGIRVHAVAPGPVGTAEHRPTGLLPGTPTSSRDEIANMVVELVCAEDGDPVSAMCADDDQPAPGSAPEGSP